MEVGDKMLIYLVGGAVLLLLICLGVAALRRRGRRREMEQRAQDRLREEALDRILVGNRQQERKNAAVAFDVRYDRKGARSGGVREGDALMLQLTESGELSTRKYMLNASDRLTIGSAFDENDIVITGENIAPCQCEILRLKKQLYVTNRGKRGQVLLRRGRKQIVLDREAVELRDKDELVIGDYLYRVELL